MTATTGLMILIFLLACAVLLFVFIGAMRTPNKRKVSGSMNISNINGMITVNGKTYRGNSVSVVNGKVIIDGKPVEDQSTEPVINITINGNCGNIENGMGDVSVKGNVTGYVQTGSGDVECGHVGGFVKTGSGNVDCGEVSGNVSTGSGDITHR